MKRCSRCKIWKDVGEFTRDKSKPDGRKYHCKNCVKELYPQNTAKRRAYDKERREKYHKERLAYLRKWRQNNPNYVTQYKAAHQNNRENLAYISRHLFNKATKRAGHNNLDITITREWVLEQVENAPNCPITEQPFVVGNGRVESYSRTLDRINPKKGYIKSNVVLISYIANKVKYNGSVEEIKLIVEHIEKLQNWNDKSWVEKFELLQLQKSTEAETKQSTLRGLKSRAKKKGIEFSLRKKDIIIPSHCPILGIYLIANNNKGPSSSTPTIDRIDNNKGYTPNNIQVISYKANAMKSSCSLEELKQIYDGFKRHKKYG